MHRLQNAGRNQGKTTGIVLHKNYTGRFVPTPSGPLYFGSIVTALASFLQARSQQGRWLVRIDDLDTPCVRAGASDDILKTLQVLSLHWDDKVLYQITCHDAYQAVLDTLVEKDLLYRCDCTRKETRGIPYPGICRQRNVPLCNQTALRIRTDNTVVRFLDEIQREYAWDINAKSGDFIIMRVDDIYGYLLSVVVDDSLQGVTEVIRGADLLSSAPEQLWVYQHLDLKPPHYGHVPVVADQYGKNLGKRDAAMDALLLADPAELLLHALQFLGQSVETELAGADTAIVINYAIEHWDISRVPKVTSIPKQL